MSVSFAQGVVAIDPVPSGGTTGQVLVKKSNSDYDTEWKAIDTSTIAGYPVVLTDPVNYDLLAFQDNTFINLPQTEVSDGGNF